MTSLGLPLPLSLALFLLATHGHKPQFATNPGRQAMRAASIRLCWMLGLLGTSFVAAGSRGSAAGAAAAGGRRAAAAARGWTSSGRGLGGTGAWQGIPGRHKRKILDPPHRQPQRPPPRHRPRSHSLARLQCRRLGLVRGRAREDRRSVRAGALPGVRPLLRRAGWERSDCPPQPLNSRSSAAAQRERRRASSPRRSAVRDCQPARHGRTRPRLIEHPSKAKIRIQV